MMIQVEQANTCENGLIEEQEDQNLLHFNSQVAIDCDIAGHIVSQIAKTGYIFDWIETLKELPLICKGWSNTFHELKFLRYFDSPHLLGKLHAETKSGKLANRNLTDAHVRAKYPQLGAQYFDAHSTTAASNDKKLYYAMVSAYLGYEEGVWYYLTIHSKRLHGLESEILKDVYAKGLQLTQFFAENYKSPEAIKFHINAYMCGWLGLDGESDRKKIMYDLVRKYRKQGSTYAFTISIPEDPLTFHYAISADPTVDDDMGGI